MDKVNNVKVAFLLIFFVSDGYPFLGNPFVTRKRSLFKLFCCGTNIGVYLMLRFRRTKHLILAHKDRWRLEILVIVFANLVFLL